MTPRLLTLLARWQADLASLDVEFDWPTFHSAFPYDQERER